MLSILSGYHTNENDRKVNYYSSSQTQNTLPFVYLHSCDGKNSDVGVCMNLLTTKRKPIPVKVITTIEDNILCLLKSLP